MLTNVVLIAILSILPPIPHRIADSVINEFVNPPGTAAEEEIPFALAEMPQYFFEDVMFCRILMGAKGANHIRSTSDGPRTPEARFAIDGDLNVYPVMGSGKNQFNDVIQSQDVTIHFDEVYDYGRFFLDLCHPMNLGETHYFKSTDELVKLQKQLYSDRFGQIRYSHPEKTSVTVEARVREICRDLDFGRIEYDEISMAYSVWYYLWPLKSGQVWEIQLTVCEEGCCAVVSKTLVADDVGYWFNRF